jgi:hypothetical protein
MSGLFSAVAAIVSICIATQCLGSSPKPDLVALIPPGSALVAGMESKHQGGGRPSLFIPLPGKSWRDVDFFNSLCGADPEKSVDEMIFVDGSLNRSDYGHTLLARGHFNSRVLYRSALSRGATQESYAGLTVIRVPPLAREHSEFTEMTLLVVIKSQFLLLGTPEYVEKEVDRFIAGDSPEPIIADQIDAARRSDVWWMLLKPSDTSTVKRSLMSLDPDLAEAVMQPNVSVRMRYGKKAEFEYQLLRVPTSEPPLVSELTRPDIPGLHAFAAQNSRTTRSRGTIQISSDRYRNWLIQIATRHIKYW